MKKSNEADFDLSFASVFKETNFALLLNGAHPKVCRDIKWLFRYAVGMAMAWFMTIQLIYSIIVKDMRSGDITEAARHGTMVIVACVISFKYMILLVHQKEILGMMCAMEVDYERARHLPAREQALVRQYAERGAWVSKLWVAIVSITTLLFPLLAAFNMISSAARGNLQKSMFFEFTMPGFEDIQYENVIFIPMFVLTTVYAVYIAMMYVSFDPLVPIFLLHSCGQLELVKIQISQLFSKEPTLTPAAAEDRLRRVIEHLQEIYRFVQTARRNFTIVYELLNKATTVLIPISLFEIIHTLKNNDTPIDFVAFFFGALVHIYIPCYYSDLLIDKSLEIVESLYSCGWECRWDRALRKDILFMMSRASTPLAMTTAFDVISLSSFTNMCRTSYSIFNLMNASIE